MSFSGPAVPFQRISLCSYDMESWRSAFAVSERKPCLYAFCEDRALPAVVFGPVDFNEFA